MFLIFKIAFRNLFRHKGRSFSMGFVLIAGTFFMTMGNGVITGMQQGLEKNIIKGLFGDITIISNEKRQDILSGVDQVGFLEQYKKLNKVISDQKYIDTMRPLITGTAVTLDLAMENSQASDMEMIYLWGIENKEYNKNYSDKIAIVEGQHLKNDEKGILISNKLRNRIYYMYDIWILPEGGQVLKDNLTIEALADIDNLKTRSDLVLMGANGTMTATDIRVPVRGIFNFKQMNEALDLVSNININFIDISSARECMGYISTEENVPNLTIENKKILSNIDDPNSFFLNDNVYEIEKNESADIHYRNKLKDANIPNTLNIQNNDIYSIAQINTSPGIILEDAVELLNGALAKAGLGKYMRAVSWKNAWPGFYGFLTRAKIILIVFVYIIYFAAILMIANALSMAAMERKAEISTMRTIGSQKRFVAGMFVMETWLLSIIFGGLGIIVGIIVIQVLAGMELTTISPPLQIIWGGSRFCPSINFNTIISGVIQLVIITIIAVLYPVIIARRIKPIDAIRKN